MNGQEPYDIELVEMSSTYNANVTDDQQLETLGVSNEEVQNEADLA